LLFERSPSATTSKGFFVARCANRIGRVDSLFPRYATHGFQYAANLDDGATWPITFALTELTAADEARIAGLLKRGAN
jgi:hypothetical protein